MIRIAFTLDDVFRAKTQQILKIYQKHIDQNFDINNINLSNNNLQKLLKFKNTKDFNTFLYDDYVFEIFGEAPVCSPSLDKKFNLWHLSINNDISIEDEIEIIFVNPMEFGSSIGFTHFFLSKMAHKVRETFFPSNSNEIWDRCDILITADMKLLKSVPRDKICVKIETPYNKEIKTPNGGKYDTLDNFFNDKNIIQNLVKKVLDKRGNKSCKLWHSIKKIFK